MGSDEVKQDFKPGLFTDLLDQLKAKFEKNFGNPLDYKRGEYRTWTQGNGRVVMVQLVEPRKNRYNERAWLVRWALGSQEIVVDQDELSFDTYNAMEVLAWAAL